jgi:hypothetical protein
MILGRSLIFRDVVGIAVILLAASAMPARAYIDPVTTSIVLQVLVGAFAAGLVAIRSRLLHALPVAEPLSARKPAAKKTSTRLEQIPDFACFPSAS